jgi:lipopolysaccharide transport system permease protein
MSKRKSLPVVVYTPESQLRSPKLLLIAMWNDLKASRELAWRLFVRDLSAQYRQSVLGIIWAFVPPIMTSLVFIYLHEQRIVNFGETDIPYAVYVLLGVILWQVFTESLSIPLKSVTTARPILAKINFPYEALVVSGFYLVAFNLSIKLIILAVVFIVFGVKLTWSLLLVPLALLMLILLGTSIGLLLTPVGMLYTDIQTALPVITQLWFFITPVVYSIPETFPFSLLAILNPVSPLLTGARDLMTKGEISNLIPYLFICFLTLLMTAVSWLIYRVSIPIIIERISS